MNAMTHQCANTLRTRIKEIEEEMQYLKDTYLRCTFKGNAEEPAEYAFPESIEKRYVALEHERDSAKKALIELG